MIRSVPLPLTIETPKQSTVFNLLITFYTDPSVYHLKLGRWGGGEWGLEVGVALKISSEMIQGLER